MVLPIIFGGVAAAPLLKQADFEWFNGLCALLAGIIPAVYKALDLDVNLKILSQSANQFKMLQDRFRQAWRVTALAGFEPFKAEFEALMDRMDAARAGSLTPPERYFRKAQEKIKSGHYDFNVDPKTQGESCF